MLFTLAFLRFVITLFTVLFEYLLIPESLRIALISLATSSLASLISFILAIRFLSVSIDSTLFFAFIPIAAFMSAMSYPFLFRSSIITLSAKLFALPASIIDCIDWFLLNAASGFFNCLSCASVSFISLPENMSARPVPINSSRVRFCISSIVRSSDNLNLL